MYVLIGNTYNSYNPEIQFIGFFNKVEEAIKVQQKYYGEKYDDVLVYKVKRNVDYGEKNLSRFKHPEINDPDKEEEVRMAKLCQEWKEEEEARQLKTQVELQGKQDVWTNFIEKNNDVWKLSSCMVETLSKTTDPKTREIIMDYKESVDDMIRGDPWHNEKLPSLTRRINVACKNMQTLIAETENNEIYGKIYHDGLQAKGVYPNPLCVLSALYTSSALYASTALTVPNCVKRTTTQTIINLKSVIKSALFVGGILWINIIFG